MKLGRLDEKQSKEFTSLVKQGTAPEDLSNHFKIGIATVHNYKKALKSQGVHFPDVRGQRPTGSIKGAGEIEKSTPKPQSGPGKKSSAESGGKGLNLTVNGISIFIAPGAKSVRVEPGNIEVDY